MTTKPSGKTGWLQLFRLGQHYMKTWPADKRLAPVFPEIAWRAPPDLPFVSCRRWPSLP